MPSCYRVHAAEPGTHRWLGIDCSAAPLPGIHLMPIEWLGMGLFHAPIRPRLCPRSHRPRRKSVNGPMSCPTLAASSAAWHRHVRIPALDRDDGPGIAGGRQHQVHQEPADATVAVRAGMDVDEQEVAEHGAHRRIGSFRSSSNRAGIASRTAGGLGATCIEGWMKTGASR